MNMIYIVIFRLVNFPGHPGQTSPPNPIEKVSNPESSHSGFSGHGKIESSKVGHTVSLDLHATEMFFYFKYTCNLVLVECEVKWRVKHTGNWLFTQCVNVGVNCDVCVSMLCYLQQTETRRITHISAEQKRRFNIKLGFDTLHNLVTTLSSQPSIKVQCKDMPLH